MIFAHLSSENFKVNTCTNTSCGRASSMGCIFVDRDTGRHPPNNSKPKIALVWIFRCDEKHWGHRRMGQMCYGKFSHSYIITAVLRMQMRSGSTWRTKTTQKKAKLDKSLVVKRENTASLLLRDGHRCGPLEVCGTTIFVFVKGVHVADIFLCDGGPTGQAANGASIKQQVNLLDDSKMKRVVLRRTTIFGQPNIKYTLSIDLKNKKRKKNEFLESETTHFILESAPHFFFSFRTRQHSQHTAYSYNSHRIILVGKKNR